MRGLNGIGIRGLVHPVSSASSIGGWNGVPLNNQVGAIGDSLSTYMTKGYLRSYYGSTVVSPYEFYALTLPKTGDTFSDGIFVPGTISAVSGNGLATIRDSRLPVILSTEYVPGICLVLGGTNDLAGLTSSAAYDTAIATLNTIYRTLVANQILPIALGIPTYTSATLRPRIPELNTRIEALAASLSTEFGFTIPYLNTYTLTDNGVDGWIAGYSSDGLAHWGPVGAAVVGQAVRDTILTPLEGTFAAPNLVSAGADTGSGIVFENGTMIDDANADGIPDGGVSPQSATYWTIVTGGADVTHSLVAEAGVVSGNWWRINKTAHTANYYALGASMAWIAEAVYELGFMCKVLNPTTTTNVQFRMYNTADSIPYLSMYLINLAEDVASFKVIRKVRAPANATNIRLAINIYNDTCDLYLGQVTIRAV